MASTNKTPNIQLSQFIGTDKPSWLSDYNSDMLKIDTAVADSDTGVSEAKAAANNALSIANQANTKSDTNTSSISTITQQIQTINSNITSVEGVANNATSLANTAIQNANNANTNLSELINALKTWKHVTFAKPAGIGAVYGMQCKYNTNINMLVLFGNATPSGSGFQAGQIIAVLPAEITPKQTVTVRSAGSTTISGVSNSNTELVSLTIDTSGNVKILSSTTNDYLSINTTLSMSGWF